MKQAVGFLLNLLIVLTAPNLFGQVTAPQERAGESSQIFSQKRQQEDTQKQAPQIADARTARRTDGLSDAERLKRAQNVAAEEKEKKKIIDEINQSLAAPEYRKKHAAFLKKKNTGIARLYPEKNCGAGSVVNARDVERCGVALQIPGGGSLYSVRLNKLPGYLPLSGILLYIEQSDIHFLGDRFVVGNRMTQDIISNIGRVNLEDLDLKSGAFKFLADFKPGKTRAEFDAQKRALEKGINENGYLYSSSAPFGSGDAYVLRSIAYRDGDPNFWNTDLLIAFKVVGQEKDGSIIILWKQFKEKQAPLLKPA